MIYHELTMNCRDIPWTTCVIVIIQGHPVSSWSSEVMVANSLPELVEAMTSNAQDGVELSQGKTQTWPVIYRALPKEGSNS